MLKKLIAFSIENSTMVLFAAVLFLLFAGWRIARSPLDIFPELNAPSVTVMTEAGGLSADEVEQYVTFPIESAVNGLTGVRRVRSASALGLSFVWIDFDWGQNLYNARQLVAERVNGVREMLPEDVHVELTPMTSLTGEIMLISISSEKDAAGEAMISPLELRAYAEFDLRNRLLSVAGVSQVVAIGGELPEYQINVRQDRLQLYGLAITDVFEAAKNAHTIASAGYIPNHEGMELPLRQTGRVRSAEDIKGTIVAYHEGAPVTIGEIAEVTLAGASKRGTASEAGHPAVILSIQKAPYMNTLRMTREIDATLDQVEKAMPDGMLLNRHVMRQSNFINLSISNVIHVLRDAAIFVVIVLVLFLMNARTTFITLTALPLSLAMAFLILDAMGSTINVMTLGGLAVAIGELVDDAIIDVENVFRRLKENVHLPEAERKPLVQVIFDASNEIRSSVVFATIIIVIVFIPLLFLDGLEGRFFRPLGIAYITSILASLLVALTVTPALCKVMLRGKLGGHEGDPWLLRKLKRAYEPALRQSVRMGKLIMGLAAAATLASLALGWTFGSSFLPEFNEGVFSVFLMAPPGTSLQESDRLATGVETQLVEIPGVLHVSRRTGRAERDEHADPVSSSEIEVSVKPGFSKEDVRRAIDEVIGDIPGITTMVDQPIQHRLSHFLSGTVAAIAINIYGDDLDKLRAIAKETEAALKALPGARDVNAQREVMIDSLPIQYRLPDLARWGLTPGTAAEQVEMAFNGAEVADINQGSRRYRMTVRLSPEERERPEQIGQFILKGMDGALVRLSEVADIGPEQTSNLIARQNGFRKAVVSCNVAEGHNLGHLVAEVRAAVDPIVHKHGYTVEYGGQFEAQQSASRTITLMGSGVLIVILLLLVSALGSFKAALLVMVNLPLAIIGGILAVYLTESSGVIRNTFALFGAGTYRAPVLSIASMVGFVTLFGIAVRNGILLVNHYQHLIEREGKPLAQAIVQGSLERLAPILMTALAATLGLIPLAMAANEPGGELLAPLAVVVLGGLVSSTILNLFVVPAGYWLIFKPKGARWREASAGGGIADENENEKEKEKNEEEEKEKES